MKQDMKYVLFTDETRATLDGPKDGLGLVLSYITVSGAIKVEVV